MVDPPEYERRPYTTALSTETTSVGELEGRPFALLRDTILYPEGGGQPPDRGRLNGIDVIDVQRAGDGIRHFLETPAVPGPAELELDWERRFDHMQQHTAQHLLSAIAADRFGWLTTSFHLGERQCDVELATPAIDGPALAELEERVMAEVRAARPVTARRVSPEQYAALAARGGSRDAQLASEIRTRGLPEGHRGDIRLVEIEGIDLTTCGGTHLASTAEIECIRLGPTESLRGGIRLHWIAGGRVRRRLALLEERNRELRLLFETSGAELTATAATRLEAVKELSRSLKRQAAELAEARAAALALGPEPFVETHLEQADGGFAQKVALEVVSRSAEKVALITATGDKGMFFCIAAGEGSGIELSGVGPEVAALFDGRGGGSGVSFQGKAASLERRAEAVALVALLVAPKKTGGRSPR